jgi:hypothetical protein
MSKNTLSRADFYRLVEWLKANHSSISPLTIGDAIVAAQSEFPGVAYSSMRYAGQVLELTFVRKRRQRTTKSKAKPQFDRVRILAREVAALYEALGHPIPERVTHIVRGNAAA